MKSTNYETPHVISFIFLLLPFFRSKYCFQDFVLTYKTIKLIKLN
jgi:hypothetical protein